MLCALQRIDSRTIAENAKALQPALSRPTRGGWLAYTNTGAAILLQARRENHVTCPHRECNATHRSRDEPLTVALSK